MNLNDMKRHWSSGIVARQKMSEFTGGLISAGHMANLDKQGLGPDRRLRIGRKVAYRVDDLIKWLESKMEVI